MKRVIKNYIFKVDIMEIKKELIHIKTKNTDIQNTEHSGIIVYLYFNHQNHFPKPHYKVFETPRIIVYYKLFWWYRGYR